MERLEAGAVRAWAYAARSALAASRDRIDAVNVFPVPDSDTGTNVLLTVTGGVEALSAVPATTVQDAHAVAQVFARGAMRSARGNSGVIVSQYLMGFAQALPARATADDVSRCLAAAARAARGSMQEPQEGTILTLADEVAGSATTASDAGADLSTMLDSVVADAHLALARISAEHPVLRAAQVLDAGACALLVLLDALARVVAGEAAGTDALAWLPDAPTAPWPSTPAGGAFEVMLLVCATQADADLGTVLPAAMAQVGDSVAVVGDGGGCWHVHVHTDDPTSAIEAARLGRREQVLVRLVEGAHPTAQQTDEAHWGVVVCTDAVGLAGWYASTGAVVVVRCPEAPVRAPHVERAVVDAGTGRVAVLTAGAADPAELARMRPGRELLDVDDELQVAVAALAFATAEPGAGLAAARSALGRLRSVELTETVSPTAVRDAADALVRSAGGAVENLTIVVRDAADVGMVIEVVADYLARHHPGVEPTVVGPTGRGPAVLLGLD